MANATYDNLWQEAMGELHEQLHVEGAEDEDEIGGVEVAKSNPPEVTIFQAFQHFACLYIKYLQIYKKLEMSYDCMIHPQKRIHVKNVLELVIRRMIELRADLVKWNPPNNYVKKPNGPEEAFPWEYVHLDDILVDLKLPPDTLEISIPKYFREDKQKLLEEKDNLIYRYMRNRFPEEIYIPDKYESAITMDQMTVAKVMEIIMRNERGRQGNERSALVRDMRDKDRQSRMYDTSNQVDMAVDVAATNLQRMMKGFVSRNIATRERDNELMFVGMKPRKDNVEILDNELQLAYRKRKQEQYENKEAYEIALEDLKKIIHDEEGPDKREELREERTLWVTDQLAQENFEPDIKEFYALKDKVEAPDADADDKETKKSGKDKKGEKGDKKDKKGGKGGKDKKGAVEPDPAEAMPKLQSRTVLTDSMSKTVQEFEDIWENKDESDNFQQKYDVNLAKEVVRPGVYEELRKKVDEMLVLNLKKLRMQLNPKDKKKKKGGKKGGKKKGGKKGGKGKKKKPLPGEKISDLKLMDTDRMADELVERQLIVCRKGRTLQSIIGEFNYLGSMHHSSDRRDEGAWEPQDPSISQIRQMLCEYCILPNGSPEIRASIDPSKLIKSVMLYGPAGTGKTLAVEVVAHELGARLIHLTPEKLRGLYPGKQGPTRLVHMVMSVARDPLWQPVVIYIDECEQFFTGGKKNKDKEGPSRFKKDLLLYKNQALGPEHRVIIIGNTRNPENGDVKDMKAFFDKFIYMPYPDYASRCLIWKYYLEQQIRNALSKPEDNNISQPRGAVDAAAAEVALISRIRQAIDRVDISSLAHVSEGYSAGAIARTVRSVVTNRRVQMLKTRPLSSIDFIDNLSLQLVTYQDDKAAFMAFTRVITGLDERRKKINEMISGEADGKKDDKKGKGKGAKKK